MPPLSSEHIGGAEQILHLAVAGRVLVWIGHQAFTEVNDSIQITAFEPVLCCLQPRIQQGGRSAGTLLHRRPRVIEALLQ